MAYITPLDTVKPLYIIRTYNECTYKIVRFKRSCSFTVYVSTDGDKGSTCGEKSDPALSRARRMVFEKALCNEWDYFFTGTLDGSKHDRFDLQSFHRKLTDFMKYRRRVYGSDIRFLLVPEKHKDGAWHVHGLIAGVPASCLTAFTSEFFSSRGLKINRKLIDSDYLCWTDFLEKFGFCSLAPIRSVVGVSYYITKYINKDLGSRRGELGEHLYYCSRGLNVARKLCEIYQPMPELDALCVNEYEFCNTGIVSNKDWVFAAEMLDASEFVSDISPELFCSEPADTESIEIDSFAAMRYENLRVKGF